MKNTGIYIHIPFCKSKCGYCDFNSYAGMEDCVAPYFSALNKEISLYLKQDNFKIETIYFGGGTPTCVDTKYIEQTLENIFSSYNVCPDAEITAECNPGTINLAGLTSLRCAGINRLSIGLQSTDDIFLKKLGRIHSEKDFEDCLKNARLAGFDNISLDLMYGLPDQTLAHWSSTLEKALTFGAEHISCYLLKIEENTPFASQNLSIPDDDTVSDMYDLGVAMLKNAGYERYEISNFAKDKKYSKHNLKYWKCDDFLGFGAGAYSCTNSKRFSNERCINTYIEKINTLGSAVVETIPESKADQMCEFVFLGLRCAGGISLHEFEKRFKCNIFDVYGNTIQKYVNLGFLILEENTLRFADKSFFVSNTILSDFV